MAFGCSCIWRRRNFNKIFILLKYGQNRFWPRPASTYDSNRKNPFLCLHFLSICYRICLPKI